MTTTYACLLRPPHWTTLPEGYSSIDASDPRGPHGTVTYPTRLDERDADHFALREIEEA